VRDAPLSAVLFNDPVYIFLFLPCVAVVYFLLNNISNGIAKCWLVAASLYFYAYWEVSYLALILASICVNFVLGELVRQQQRWALRLGIAFNLLLLGYYKYADFFISNVNALFSSDVPSLNLLLPLSISFFTFQQIAYLVDCFRGQARSYSFLNYCLFVTFFPQLIAGPIVHHKEMMPQFADVKRTRPDLDHISQGLFLFSLGLIKKLFIADSFAVWADAGYAADSLNMVDAWITTLSYSLQLYFDFSGYSDMAIGAALLFNIRLPINFNSPYKAVNIQDFWRRWHITLSNWLRDYVYIPLGGNRCSVRRTYINLGLTFLLGGLWHGAGWTFVLWGAMHGSALAIHRYWQRSGRKMPVLPAWTLTLLFAHLAWVMFGAENLDQALGMYTAMVDFSTLTLPSTLASQQTWLHLAVFLPVALYLPNSLQLSGYLKYQGKMSFRHNPLFASAIAVALFYALLAGVQNVPTAFLYFNF
jgi:D-alanyl-lipoteichoic acid acyltransferase DltB (MBOAT superfamily)